MNIDLGVVPKNCSAKVILCYNQFGELVVKDIKFIPKGKYIPRRLSERNEEVIHRGTYTLQPGSGTITIPSVSPSDDPPHDTLHTVMSLIGKIKFLMNQ